MLFVAFVASHRAARIRTGSALLLSRVDADARAYTYRRAHTLGSRSYRGSGLGRALGAHTREGLV